MKIKRFNESDIDKDYLNNCFIDLVDSKQTAGFTRIGNNIFIIRVNLPKISGGTKTIESAIKEVKLIESTILDIEDGINKIKVEYPEIKYELRYVKSSKLYELKIMGDMSKFLYNGQKYEIPFPKEWGVVYNK